MKKMNRLLALTAASVVAAQTGFAQTVVAPDPVPAPAPAPISLDFLGTLFSGTAAPDEQGIRDAFATAGLTVDRYRERQDGEIRVRALTADGQVVRVRIEDGEVRYSLRSNGGSTDGNGDDSTTSDANGSDTSDSTGDGNGNGSRSGNSGGGSGGGNGGES